ncbi:MAG: hypothetical protein HC880_07495 [Bacteroidia bacterium]|nr:hypothetical protein [Bacteroidia bacterium]
MLQQLLKKPLNYYLLVTLLPALLLSCQDFLTVERENLVDTGVFLTSLDTSAVWVGEIVDLNLRTPVTQHGHCWDTLPGPGSGSRHNQLGAVTQTGRFTSTLRGLRPQTRYYDFGHTWKPGKADVTGKLLVLTQGEGFADPGWKTARFLTSAQIQPA